MAVGGWLRPLRGAVGNAVVWGLSWGAGGFLVYTTLRLTGLVPDRGVSTLLGGLMIGVRAGIVGAIAGSAFSILIRFGYRGRRLSDINWVRFGIAGGIATGVFVPLFLQAMNILSGDGMVPWRLVLDDAVWTSVFGAFVAGGSLKLAQRVALSSADKSNRLAGAESLERLTAGDEADPDQ